MGGRGRLPLSPALEAKIGPPAVKVVWPNRPAADAAVGPAAPLGASHHLFSLCTVPAEALLFKDFVLKIKRKQDVVF